MHTMKAFGGRVGMAALILSCQLHTSDALPSGKHPWAPIEYKAGCAPGSVWMLSISRKSHPREIESHFLGCPAYGLVTVPTILSRLYLNLEKKCH